MANDITLQQEVDVCQILNQGGVKVGSIAALVLEGVTPNLLIGRVVACTSNTAFPTIRIILTEAFGLIPAGTIITIDARDIAAFGPINLLLNNADA